LSSVQTIANNASGEITFGGIIGGLGGIVSAGSGTLTLSGSNTFSGGLTDPDGTLILGNNQAAGSGYLNLMPSSSGPDYNMTLIASTPLTISNSYTFGQSRGDTTTVIAGTKSITFSGSYNSSGNWGIQISNILASGATLTLSGAIPIAANGTGRAFQINGTGNNVISGSINDGPSGAHCSVSTTGTGVTTLSGTNTYSGGTTVGGGTLTVNGVVPTNTLTVNAGATLSGNGIILGPTIVSGILSPGNPTGTLSFSNSLTLSSGSVSSFGLGTNSDLVVAAGNLTLGGTLSVTNLGGLTAGTNKLFTYGGNLSGSFTLGMMPTGFNAVLATNVPGQVNLILTSKGMVTGPSVTMSKMVSTNFILRGTGGLATSNYFLLASTNLALPLTNWTPILTNYFDSNGAFSNTIPMNPTVPSTFYRIKE